MSATRRRFLTAASLGAAASALPPAVSSPVADEPPSKPFARVELQGELGGPPRLFTRDSEFVVVVRVARKGKDAKGAAQEALESQTFILVLPDETTRKVAKALVGKSVVVSGDVLDAFEATDGSRGVRRLGVWIRVKVTSLKQAEPNAKLRRTPKRGSVADP